ncbi:hypothetical protein [Actinacidiphila oryziradicis]|uniref:Uncharacterized protein n=1 Tax=Actinacidiphila oryziradicis TaxID=2571141 RepID=A0A4U0S6T5_9ACTN|nr:hypothetical protein [Actinacidiphila oryziradicis]TKA04824.1 hypothetical protein FCI23_34185 [Actinacidiphila oryziradicis]
MSVTTFAPATYYAAVVQRLTETCPNYLQPIDVPQLYSNGGTPGGVQCGLCQHSMDIMSATVLDPQPEVC